MAESDAITFGECRLDRASGSLHRDGVTVALTPKAYALLRHLLAHPGELLTKDDLLDAVWPESAVSDTVLKVCVAELRKALGDEVAAPRYVATVHRRGYRFIAAVAAATGSRVVAPSRPAAPGIVGRAAALTQLDDALAAALAGTRQLVFVTGETGIGKTTVVERFLAGLDPALPRGRGQCREEDGGGGEPYGPLLDALARVCRDPERGAAVLSALQRSAPTWIAALPGLGTADGAPAATTRTRMLLELVEALEELSTATPLVLVLEDLHWSDYSTLDLLSLFARRPEPARVLVVATYRPVDVVVRAHPLRRLKDDLALQQRCREIPLEFLTEADVADHLRQRLATTTLPDDLARRVHARTDGNPLFMTHVVDLLLARRWLTCTDDTWSLATTAGDEPEGVPDTLRQLIAQEIASLAPDVREVLAAASVAGTEHAAAAVAAGLDAPLAAVEDVCVALAGRGQMLAACGTDVWPDGTRTPRFSFIHALYQSTLYGDLAPAHRNALHRRIGLRLEQAFGSQTETIAAELARHFGAAGDVPRAVRHHRAAAERMLGRHAYPEAIEHLDRALALLAREPDDVARARHELDLCMALGPALMAVRGFAAPEVEHCYARARTLCHVVGVIPARARALRGLGVFALTRGDLVQARQLAEESLALAESSRTPEPLAKAHVTMGTTLYYFGELDAAATHLDRARRLFARTGARSTRGTVQAPRVNALAFLAMTTWFRGRPDAALGLAEEARVIADELAHPVSVLWAAHVTAILRHARGEAGPAADAAAVAIRVAGELGLRQWTAWGVFFHGWLATTDGRLADGIAAMHAGLDEYRATGAELGRTYLTATLAEAHGRAGETARALALVDESLALTTARSERYYAPELHRLRAGFLDDAVAAEAELRRAVTLASQQGNRALALRAATDLARRLGGAGGRRLLMPHYRRFREGLDTGDLRAARATLDELPAVTTPRRRRP